MPFIETPADAHYDVVIIGTGFAGTFFLKRYLAHAKPSARVLVLERGPMWPHERQIKERRHDPELAHLRLKRTGRDLSKTWFFTLAFGGGSNCWWSNAPRMLPVDFQTKTRLGIGRDWPFSYDDLAPYYDEAERDMGLAGLATGPWPYPRTGGYPLPPHRLNRPEQMLRAAYPDKFFNAPSGRASAPEAGRSVCCGNGVCHLCPVDSKFTVQNSLMAPYEDPRVDVILEAEATAVDIAGDTARGVRFARGGRDRTATADLVVLGANAIYNPLLLQASGVTHPLLGRRLNEQVGLLAEVKLKGVDSFQGSTSVTGHGYWLYDDEERRKTMAGCLVTTWNIGELRTEFGRWRQLLPVRLVYEVLPLERNFVAPNPEDPTRPIVHWDGHDEYTERAIRQAKSDLERVMAPLPVEDIVLNDELQPTEAHICGTTVMGNDPADSIVDQDGRHHRVRNLVVLGSGNFPVSGPANPTLTLAAHALRSAHRILGASHA